MHWVVVGFHTDASVAGVETGDHLSVRRIGASRGTIVHGLERPADERRTSIQSHRSG